MTVVADSKHRVTLRHAKPGDRFDLAMEDEGRYVLTKLEPGRPRPAKARFEKRDGYTVVVSDKPVSEAAIKEALAEFP